MLGLLICWVAVAGAGRREEAGAPPSPAAPLVPASRATAYPIDDQESVGAFDAFRELFVDPDTFASTLRPARPPVPTPATGPVAPPPPATGTLPIENDTSSWAEVAVNDARVGIVEPYTHAAIRGVTSGTYEVTLTLQNGYREQRAVQTEAPPSPPAGPLHGPLSPPPADAPHGG